MRIEILVVPDCPNTQRAVGLMRGALDDVGLHDARVTTRVVADLAEAEQLGFAGSPAFLIDGRDPFAEPGHAPGLASRVYRTPDGMAGLPERDQLHRALRTDC